MLLVRFYLDFRVLLFSFLTEISKYIHRLRSFIAFVYGHLTLELYPMFTFLVKLFRGLLQHVIHFKRRLRSANFRNSQHNDNHETQVFTTGSEVEKSFLTNLRTVLNLVSLSRVKLPVPTSCPDCLATMSLLR